MKSIEHREGEKQKRVRHSTLCKNTQVETQQLQTKENYKEHTMNRHLIT